MPDPEPPRRGPLRVLIIEDSEDDAVLVLRALTRGGYQPSHHRVETRAQLQGALERDGWDIILADYYLPRFGALEALAVLRQMAPDLPLIIVSGAIGEDRAVDAMHAGAQDYVMKDNLPRLCPAIERELRDAAVRRSRRDAERALREREARLSAVMENVAEGILCIDEAGQIESFNTRAGRLFGLSAARAEGSPVDRLLTPDGDRRPGWIPELGEHACTGLRSDGTVFDVEMTVSPMELHGRGLRVVSVRDVTERNRLTRQLLEQTSLARLGELAAVVAHEVRNPLAGIRGAIEIIGRPLTGDDQEIVGEILDRIDALNRVVGDLLLFARPRLPAPERVPLRSVVEETIGLITRDPEWNGIRIEVHGPPAEVPLDVEMFKPVIHNVLLNAAQAMEGRGLIRIEIDARPAGCRLSLHDTGPGVPAEIRDRLFEPFYTTKHQGTGLGLPTARRVVEAHGGRIELDCPEGGGTRITIELPTG